MPKEICRTTIPFPAEGDIEASVSAAYVFEQLHHHYPQAPAGFLDSSDSAATPAPERSRYSILAFSLGSQAKMVRLHGRDAVTQWLQQHWEADLEAVRGGAMTREAVVPSGDQQASASSVGPPFQLGWVGAIGYEWQTAFFWATHAVVIDHRDSVVEIQTLEPDSVFECHVVSGLQADATAVGSTQGYGGTAGATQGGAIEEGAVENCSVALSGLTARDSRDEYLWRIHAAKEQIRDGNSYEICLTTAVTGELMGSSWATYSQLRAANRAPFTQYLWLPGVACGAEEDGDVAILSTSPERFMEVTAEGVMRSEPIKGTRPRGATEEEDLAWWRDLTSHPKDRAENVMIADLVRNDLSIHAVPGSLRAERLCAVESYPTVHQMVSTLTARLAPGASRVRAMRDAFPPGSMTGAPKISTMSILGRLESGPRGFYSGVAGYFSRTGACDLSVLIRTAVLSRDAQNDSVRERGASGQWNFHLGLGGAITADSHPEAEWQEVQAKARGVLGALGEQFPGA